MRTLTVAELALLKAARFDVYTSVELEDQTGAWRDVSAWGGRNYFVSATWTRDQDTAVMTGTLTLSRVVTGASIAPGMQTAAANIVGGVYVPFVRGAQGVRIRTACTVADVAPVAGDWREVFLGKVDDPDWGGKGNQMVLAIGDIGGWLTQTQIEDERVYGSDAGTLVETVIQSILDDNPQTKLAGVTLYVPTSPAWHIHPYTQSKTNVMDAIRTLAQQIGWDVRFMYDAADVFRLTLYQPARDKTVADWTIGPNVYFDLPSVKAVSSDVRNFWRVKFVDHATGLVGESTAHDDDSIAAFGLKYAEIDQSAASNIDSQTEADALTSSALADTKSSLYDQQMRSTYFWCAELGDLAQHDPNGEHYDAAVSLAVQRIEHTLSRDRLESVISTAGAPRGAYSDWLRKIGTFNPPPAMFTISDISWTDDAGTGVRTYRVVSGKLLTHVYVFDNLTASNPATTPWPAAGDAPTLDLTPDADGVVTFDVARPVSGSEHFIQIEGRDADLTVWDTHRALWGLVSSVPTIAPRLAKSADGATVDVFATVACATGENIRLFVKLTDDALADVFGLVVSDTDSTPRFVASATELGPTDWFVTGVAAPVQALSGVALTREQVARIYLMGQTEESEVESLWLPVATPLKDTPWLENADLHWNPDTGNLSARTVGGAKCGSCKVEFSPTADFSASVTVVELALIEDQDVTTNLALRGTDLGKPWYMRATPSNGPIVATHVSGLAGGAQAAAVNVASSVTIGSVPSETLSTGTQTTTIVDPWDEVDPAVRVEYDLTLLGVGSTVAPTTAPAGAATAGVYTLVQDLDPKHTFTVQAKVTLLSTVVLMDAPATFDSDKRANVLGASAGIVDDTATISANFDTDTGTGGAQAQWSDDDGATWNDVTVDSRRLAAFTYDLLTSPVILLIRGKDVAGTAGPSVSLVLPAGSGSGGGAFVTGVDVHFSVPGQDASALWSFTGTLAVDEEFILLRTWTDGATNDHVSNPSTIYQGTNSDPVFDTVLPYTIRTGSAVPLVTIGYAAGIYNTTSSTVTQQCAWVDTTLSHT
jgi:hypothetical protein